MMNTKTLSHWPDIKYTLPIFLIVAVFLLAGCGGGSTTGSSSTPTATTGSGSTGVTPTTGTGITPTITTSGTCTFVTAAQASTILGGTVQTQSSSVSTGIGTGNANACVYTSSQGGGATLAVVSSTDAATAQSTFTQLQQVMKTTSGSQYQDVTGLGDSAFTTGKTLYVLKGKTWMFITVTNNDSTKILPEEKQFALDALPHVS